MNWISNVVRPKIRSMLNRRDTPENLWIKCPDTGQLHFVKDVDASKRFYIDLLGMTVHYESDWQSFLWCGEQQVALFQQRDGAAVKTGAELNHMALRMEPASYAQVKARLEREGIEVSGRPGDPTCVYFHDPDGHRL